MKPGMHTQDDKKGTEQNKVKASEDKLSTPKSYRRAQGLCLKCVQKWSHGHKCPPIVSLHALVDVWQFLSEGDSDHHASEDEDQDSGDELMAISVQALQGTEGSQTIRFWGFLAGKEVFMLVDSGSSHYFIDQHTTDRIWGWQALNQPVKVRVANGSEILCTHELPNTTWGLQGHTFQSSFKIISLGCYDIILGMDWLSQYSPMHVRWAKRWL